MKWLLRFIWMFWMRQQGRRAVHKVKAQGVLVYLKTLSMTRKTLIVVILATVFMHLFLMACVGLIVTSILLYKEDMHSGLQMLFYGFGAAVALFLFVGTLLLSQSLWYRFSGAKKLVQDLEKEAA